MQDLDRTGSGEGNRYGFDLDCLLKKIENEDLSSLRDGVVLCELVNVIWGDNTIDPIHPHSSYSFKHLENLDAFFEAISNKGLKEEDLCDALDLFDQVS